MRGKGINYDTGARLSRGWTRETFDATTVRRDMRVIADDLHCTAVRISGSDPERLTIAGEQAAGAGLQVWFAPFPCDLTTEGMLPLFADCATRAEDLRRRGADVFLVIGGELSIFSRGFLPGDDLFARTALLATPGSDRLSLVGEVQARLNAFLAEGRHRPRQIRRQGHLCRLAVRGGGLDALRLCRDRRLPRGAQRPHLPAGDP